MSETKKKKHHKKKRVILPYITRPIIYLLISLVFIVPVCFGMLNMSVGVVHKAQQTLSKSISDIQLNDSDYTPSDKMAGTAELPALKAGGKIGVVSCDTAGLECSVYYGNNRVSYRGGAGLSSEDSLPGLGGEVLIYADASGGFKALENVEIEDIITFTTSWGVYKYEVTDFGISKNPPAVNERETLVLLTQSSKKAFALFSGEKRYVTADYISGPKAE